MVYVPASTHSVHATELAKRLHATIDEYRSREAKLTDTDIQLALATIHASNPVTRRKVRLIGSAVAVASVTTVGVIGTIISSVENGRRVPMIAVAAIAAVGLVTAFVLILRVSSD
jgi:hypothetical protein